MRYFYLGDCYHHLEDYLQSIQMYTTSYQFDTTNYYAKYNIEMNKALYDNPGWSVIDRGNDRVYLADKKRIIKEGKKIRMWIKLLLLPVSDQIGVVRENWLKKLNISDYKYERFLYSLSLYEFDCSKNKIRCTQSLDYNEDGGVINSFNLGSNVEWDDVIPNSIGEGLFNFAKNYK
jgi:hypothetical protein